MTQKKIRIAVIGAGRIGTYHARILGKHPGVELVGVCDTNLWRAQVAAWRSGSAAFREYAPLLSKIDAAIVAVPTEKHFEVGSAALAAGVHCLIEKPIAGTLAEAKDLLALSEEKGVVLQVGHVERFNPAVLKAIEYVRHPRFITVERLGPYDPRVAGIGVVLDLMIHDLDILLTLVGSEVESLEAIGASLFGKHEDIANVRVRFKTGCVADLTASRISLNRCRKVRMFQEDSYLSLDYMNSTLKVCKKKSANIKSLKDVEILTPKLDKKEPLRNEIDHFLDCIRHDRKPWVSGEHGIEALKLALQITEELEKYELSDHTRSPSFIPSWASGLGRTLKTVGKSVLGEKP
ncbi:MAG TPA: Gfo/Idh/MocA family oxidoreductase [Elusimicrobiota bacterium]|jgi:predicted dehydrogenase|nr:Gfo/Idh/MocA family oxidoreductase [Elusimicrobiota bacterium]